MEQEQIIDILKKLLLDLGKPLDVVNNLKLSSNIRLDLGLDSVALVYIMFQLQNKYKIDAKNADFNKFILVSDFVNFLKENME